MTIRVLSFIILLIGLARAEGLFRITVVDAENGWPVPMVELRTTHQVSFFSDNAGLIAFDLPELMGVETWFSVEGHGYEVKADGFGYRGVKLTPKAGGEAIVKVVRQLPGKRLGRLTGAGLFGESQRFGMEKDWQESGVMGCDSVQPAAHMGKMYWAWGDTSMPGYPLGLFHMTGAVTELKPMESFEPPVRVRFDYFRDEAGKVRSIAQMAGDGPTWLGGCVSVPDAEGKERLVAIYDKIQGHLTTYERGLCVWNEEAENFEKLKVLWTRKDGGGEPPLAPNGHPVKWRDEKGGEWLLFGDPFPSVKCPATFEGWGDPAQWVELTPQKEVMSAEGRKVVPHRGAIAWNESRQRWVSVFTQKFGKPSAFGEIWYAESDEATGPWGPAVKVVTHHNYTFYNPCLHSYFTEGESGILLFEATFTSEFADKTIPSARYNYNQVLYRLDLNDPALAPARKK
ncbi:hypothetical protein V2O64_15440 [Verrucomicrobiaceae bacterium 227]